MTAIAHLPQDDRANGWSAILPKRQPSPALDRQVDADWVVVGAGYAGLAAARRLAENRPGERILLLDAHEAGENASGRNSGFAIDLPHNVGSALNELEGSYRFMRLARAAIDYLKTQVQRHGIACDWSKAGKYHAAVSAAGMRTILEPFARELEALREPLSWIERRQPRRKHRLAAFHRRCLHAGLHPDEPRRLDARSCRPSARQCHALRAQSGHRSRLWR
jgi:glycine/D-amino acid oxidase-like deaminating enzyme